MTAAAVVYGPLLGEHGLGLDGWRASGIPTSGVRRQQPARIPLGFAHQAADYRIGEVVHLELRADRSLWCVAEIDDYKPADGNYFSVEAMARKADGGDAKIIGVALCRRSSTLGLRPVTFLHGGGLEHRGSWATTSFEKALLGRAAETRRRRKLFDPIVVHTEHPRIETRIQRVFSEHRAGDSVWLVDDDRGGYLVNATPTTRPPGKVEHSRAFEGSVIRVR